MKFTWTEADIIPGRWVCKPAPDKTIPGDEEGRWEPNGWTAKWTSQISWIASLPSAENMATTCITDGMITPYKSKGAMAASFNRNGIRPMPHKWLMATIDYLRDCQIAS